MQVCFLLFVVCFSRIFTRTLVVANEADAELTQSLIDHVATDANDGDDDDGDNDDDEDDGTSSTELDSSSVKMPAPAELIEPKTKPPAAPKANGWYYTVSARILIQYKKNDFFFLIFFSQLER